MLVRILRPVPVLLLFLVAVDGFAQSPGGLNAEMDVATFTHPSRDTQLDLYFSFEAQSLPFRKDSVGYRALLPIDVELRPQALPDSTPEPTLFQTQLLFSVDDPGTLRRGQHFIHQFEMLVAPNTYEVSVLVRSTRGSIPLKTFQRTITVPSYADSSRVLLSDLILASSITQTSSDPAVMVRNGLAISPNPQLLFGQGMAQLYYYVEVYRAGLLDSTHTVRAFVAESNRQEGIEGFENRSMLETTGDQLLIGSFDLSTLGTGSYDLNVQVVDAEETAVASSIHKFFVYNPNAQPPNPVASGDLSFESSLYAVMLEEEVDLLYKQVALIATEDERRRMRRIKDLDERRRFLYGFWNKRDSDPNRGGNAAWDDFKFRLQYAQERFGGRNREGWETDRGRVVLKYGIPDDVQDRRSDSDVAPHSLWTYTNIPGIGQAFFVFADMMGFNAYELIHSDVPGERRSLDWQAELRRGR